MSKIKIGKQMRNKEPFHMNIREKMFHEMIDKNIFHQAKEYAFKYADKSLDRNVYPTSEAIQKLRIFDEELPGESAEPSRVLELLNTYGSPATVSQTGGRYFGLVTGGIIPIALAVKWLSDFWDQNTPLNVTSPIASKLESVVEKWLLKLFNLPDETAAGFVSGSSMAILSGLAAARWRIYERLNYDVNLKGLTNAPKIRIVAGKHIHGAVLKAIALLGLGKDNIEWVDVDDQGRIIQENIPQLDDKTILILQAGNVNSGSFDNFDLICNKAIKANSWVHIDGAFGLWASGSEKLKHLTNGIEKANSWSVDGHKTLNTPYDCGIILCNDKEALVSALQATGSYIIYGESRDGMLYTPEMSRRARIVELWATMKYLGKQGIDSLVLGLHERAVQFSNELREEGFQILNDVVFNQVLVSCENDDITLKTLETVQESLECWCGGAQWDNRKVIRISVCSWATTSKDISRSVKAFVNARNKYRVLDKNQGKEMYKFSSI
jgi:glutamate/tyrosine decarboxylase-like PLP-dependent enzyme